MPIKNFKQLKGQGRMAPDKKRIYIVDDDVSVCRALKILLVTCGFAVETFSSAEEYFIVVPDSAAGCLIMDIHLPGLSGWEALQRLATSGSRRPVIIITADKNENLKQKALKAGAVGLLQKPFYDNELIEMINQNYQAGEDGIEKKPKTRKLKRKRE